MTQWEAVQTRISCRAYQETLLPGEVLGQLEEKIAALNAASGLRFCLCVSRDPEKPAVKLAGAMFSGRVTCCAALFGGEDDLSGEKVGYYGQELVLFATRLGLGTCWVAGTYDARSLSVAPGPGEKLWDVIPMGYAQEKTPRKQTMIRAAIRRRSRKLESFVESETPFADLPDWVKRGAEAVSLGPSAVNQQPFNVVWRDDRVFAKLWKNGHGLGCNDMGIAKKQFEVGAAACGVKGTWQFGDGGEFVVTD